MEEYQTVIDTALVTWGMTTTGNAKADLIKLLTAEINAALDPDVSSRASELVESGAMKEREACAKVAEAHEAACCTDGDCASSVIAAAIRARTKEKP